MTLAAELHQGVEALGLAMPQGGEAKLLAYLALLVKWNKVYNLTAVRREDEMLVQHLFDSLAVLSHLGPLRTLADVGSGAGLPGIPLAIARPDLALTSIEAIQKKAAFQQQAKIELDLPNFNVFCGRAEEFQPTGGLDGAISRAFSELAEFVRLAAPLLRPGGRLFAMKGLYPAREIKDLPAGWEVAEAMPLQVPRLAAQRHLIVIERR